MKINYYNTLKLLEKASIEQYKNGAMPELFMESPLQLNTLGKSGFKGHNKSDIFISLQSPPYTPYRDKGESCH